MPSYWRIAINRKRFFDGIAKKKGYDPLIANNWYKINHDSIYAEKVQIIIIINND